MPEIKRAKKHKTKRGWIEYFILLLLLTFQKSMKSEDDSVE
jgi:hypothetical protein